jgi:signal peptidase I
MDRQRDPRKDPRPGDVTRDRDGVALVVRVTPEEVYWAVQDQLSDELRSLDTGLWISLSQTDEVLHVAE